MRRTLLFLSALILLMAIAPSAAADMPPKGCPAEASVWTEVDYVASGTYTGTTFYTWYWSVGDQAAITTMRAITGWTDDQIYFFFADFFVDRADRNADSHVCVSWLGGNPGILDDFLSIVDNNSATKN
jgi:hypothetical protein